MKQFNYIIVLITLCTVGVINPIQAQLPEDSEVFKTLKTNDSLIFNLGFNICDMSQFASFITDDLEFYHDQSGVLNSKEEFLKVMANGICKKDTPYKVRRELLAGSLKVFPLYENGKLYGAIQNGNHKFFELFEGNEKAGNIARFSHLWILDNSHWKIKRIYSFDHKL